MKKLKFLLFILPFLFGFNVFAKDVDVTSNCYGTTGYSSMYSGDEVQYQTYSNYNFGTTYQFQLSSFETELRYSLSANTDYTITFNTNNSNDFRNNFRTYNVYDLNNNDNNLVTGFTFVSAKKVQISFKTTTATNKVKIQMGGSNVYDNITGETNWNIKNAILTIPESAPSGSTSQDVIDNATQNTNTIVNNNNQNTNNIINNNNQNTQDIINNQNELLGDCITNYINTIISLDNVYQNGNSFQQITADTATTKNIVLQAFNNGTYQYLVGNPLTAKIGINSISFTKRTDYNQLKFKINGIQRDTGLLIDVSNLKNDVVYYITADFTDLTQGSIKFGNLMITEKPYSKFVNFGDTLCQSKLDSTNSAINDVNNSINNSNVENGTGESFFNDFTSQDFGLSQIITIPLNTIQSLTSKSCVPLQVPIPFTNSNVSLPCMTEIYETKFPTIYNLWKIVSFGIVAYLIAIDIFHIVKGFKDPESDKVEVLDL